ncbi:fimbrial biogenesis chaperone [[Enterobacter] lignolyticus]|uniref:P pilus assembly protein chaperone PapD-like protein n=1 Tax=Enterobacter lignolyticus (strain SCF1) TaxID=701347 RepID=E3G7A6_ENTLS|nr:molecular chaperone [[Enterobacter] lignolyticus]ADO48528.1 P pilus assembly protein chaperone PapD-like protein [[Enterobacter] lignolyticus SCF1]
MKLTLRVQSYAFACLLGSIIAVPHAAASGLQIAPVTLTLQGTQNADGIWLSNEGDNAINAQVRVYRWTQSGFADQLSSSQGLAISPPMLALAPGERQLIRVIRTGPPSGQVESAYRLSIDELPPPKLQRNKLQFVLRYSVPVFIQPVTDAQASAKLQWKLQHIDGNTFLEVNNQGNSHAQLSAATLIGASGTRIAITPGLLGYVLPGSTMRWILSPSANGTHHGGKVEVTINGQKTIQDL